MQPVLSFSGSVSIRHFDTDSDCDDNDKGYM